MASKYTSAPLGLTDLGDRPIRGQIQQQVAAETASPPAAVVAPTPTAATTIQNLLNQAGTTAAANAVVDPRSVINPTNGTSFYDRVPQFNAEQVDAGIQKTNPANPNIGELSTDARISDATLTAGVTPKSAAEYDVAKTYDQIAQETLKAAQGQLSDKSIIQAEQINVDATGKGLNETGKALDDYATLELDDVDPRATAKGQLEALQSEFVGPDGEAKIPAWAAGTARNVSKIASFSGMTGSAATAAMAQAIMEASLPIATADAAFFQTVSLTNLNNKQTSIINKANVLAQFDIANLDARMTAAVENSKNFLAMDMANLNNEQQARVINNQNRVQSILEDSKQENAKRLFVAESANDMNKFYDTLNSSIAQFNSSQVNGMKQFNTSETNGMIRFNRELENNRQQFYSSMQYNIDTANAKWRQTVTLTNTDMAFQAAATDVKNLVGISVEQLNQQWDRADALLDYVWKSSENEQDRNSALAIAKLQADAATSLQKLKGKQEADAASSAGLGKLVGTGVDALLGSEAGKSAVNSVADSLFGWLG